MTGKQSFARFARNAAANWITWMFAAVVGFFLSPYIVGQLGATRYGVWSLIVGLVGYLGLLDIGIRQAVNRYTARLHAAGDHEEASRTISAALRLFSLLGLVAIALSGVLAYYVPLIFNIPAELADESRHLVLITGAGIAVSLVGGVFGGIVTGLERFDVQCVLEVAITTLRTIAIVLALRSGYGLVALAIIMLVTAMLTCGAYYAAARALYQQLRIRLTGVLGPQLRKILTFSASLTVIYTLGRIINYSQTAVIGAFLPIEAVTFFAIAFNLCVYANEVSRSLANLMTPRVSAQSTSGGAVGDLILRVAKVATIAVAPICAVYLLRGESFISLWMGPEYGPRSGEVLKLMAVTVCIEASRSVIMQSLTGMAEQHKLIPALVIEAAVNLTLSLYLVQRFGILGVALATAISSSVVSLAYIPNVLNKAAGVPVRQFLVSALLLPVLAAVPFAGVMELVEHYYPARNLPIFFFQVMLALPLVPITAWFLCLSNVERAQIRLELARRVR